MYTDPRKREWWEEPSLAKRKVSVPRHLKNHDPVNSDKELPNPRQSKIGAFLPSRRWVRYNRLQSMEIGYVVPVFDLRAIGMRYGLSQNAQRYFRKHILPEPFDIVRRRSVQAHHWSRFTLMGLDVVLRDLEDRGYRQFKKQFDEHVDLLHYGVEYMHGYYAEKAEIASYQTGDEFGVEWDQ